MLLGQDSKISFLEKVLGKGHYSHNTKELGVMCPYCFHHKKKLFINLKTDNWHCFVCGKAGKNLLFLLKKIGSKHDIDAYLKQHKAKDVQIKNVNLPNSFKLSLPKDFTSLMDSHNSLFGQRAWKYLTSRGVTEQDILRNKIGISLEDSYYNRVILPSFDKDGFLNFYTARAICDLPLNYLDPLDLPKGYKKQVIFNELNIDWEKPVVLTEGYFDMLKADNAIPLFGSILDIEHAVFQAIVRNGSSVVLALDSDALKKSMKIASLFMSYDVVVYNLDVSPFKDLGQMSKEDFEIRYNKATVVTESSIYRERLKMVCA